MSETNLQAASHQWAVRPADERYEDLGALFNACNRYKRNAREIECETAHIIVRPCGSDGADLGVLGSSGAVARLSHWSFGQLSRLASAPPDYLRRLSPQLAADNLNHGLTHVPGKSNLLLHREEEDNYTLRSAATDSYSRIWNADVVQRLLSFPDYGWRVPPARPALPDQPGTRPATEQDVLCNREGGGGLSVNVGDLIAPAGLYASDHDMFVFLVNESRRIHDGTHAGLSRGFFLSNSEVANGRALKLTTFLYRHVCGNHIVWGASGVQELRIAHRGSADRRFQQELYASVRAYSESSAREEEERIASAKQFRLGAGKDEVLDALFTRLRGDLPRVLISGAYDRAVLAADRDDTLDPNTAWGFVQGATELSQQTPYADERDRIDRAAGKVLSLAF